MGARVPCKTGLSLSLTMAASYFVCAVLYGVWPEQGINFLNALFHGLDFHLLFTAKPFTLDMFTFPLIVLVVWGFVIGTLFAWLDNLLHRY